MRLLPVFSTLAEEMWEDADQLQLEADFPPFYDEPPALPQQNTMTSKPENVLLTWLLLFLLRLQAKHYIPDSAVNCLLKFLYMFFSIVGRHSDFVANLAGSFPMSVYQMQKFFGIKEEFARFIVCRKCYSVYEFKNCIEQSGVQLLSKTCNYRPHPNSRSQCGVHLLRSVTLLSGKQLLYPFKVFCYQGLRVSIQNFLLRPGFVELCEHWRSLPNSTELRDIYDGKIWKEFQHLNGQPALADSYVYAVMLNIDWFQPFKLTNASVGAMYLTVMNLPYNCRFKRENVILLGVIPGPTEPPRDINQYLEPFVTELQQFLTGIPMTIHGENEPKMVRCLLLGVACDMPAGRKACGFLSHSALLGCNKCYKTFPGGVGSKDYSGFNRDMWQVRTNVQHRSHIQEIQKQITITARNELESKFGCRYSVLLELPYFDPVRMLVIDPMHNLFLGTAKHTLKDLWMNGDPAVLTPADLCTIQERVDNMNVPADIGRIPRKIETGFSGSTADQYKNWVTLYSVPCLYSIIDNDKLECWRHFVLACRLLCKRSLTQSDITLADALLLQFCRRVQQPDMFGKKAITPNMHMHCHLKSVILDFGPLYAFWLFSYERYNGILGNQPSSNRSIEIQLMRRFNRDSTAYVLPQPVEFSDELAHLCTLHPRVTGSLLAAQNTEGSEPYQLGTSCTIHTFCSDKVQALKQILMKIFSMPCEEISVNAAYRKYKSVTMNGVTFRCSTCKKLSIALACWDDTLFGCCPTPLACSTLINPQDATHRPVNIEYFVKISYTVCNSVHTMCFVVVAWFQPHPSRFEIGKPAQVWCKQLFESAGLHSFLPIHHLCCRCVYSTIKLHEENVLVVVPLVE